MESHHASDSLIDKPVAFRAKCNEQRFERRGVHMPDLSFDVAVGYVLRRRAATCAFVPCGEPPVDGDLYVLTYNTRYVGDPDNEYLYEIWYAGGRFHSSSVEEDDNVIQFSRLLSGWLKLACARGLAPRTLCFSNRL